MFAIRKGAVITAVALMAFVPGILAQDDLQDVLKVDATFNDAIRRNDAQGRAGIYSDTYIITNVRGQVITKSQALEEVTSGQVTYESFLVDDVKVRSYGDVAVVTGRTSVHRQVPSGDYRAQQRYTRVYVKRQGRWQLDVAQITAIVPSSPVAGK
jgi:ketosteroid isomerase-like protein